MDKKSYQMDDKADKWIRKLIDNLFEWIEKESQSTSVLFC